MTRLTWIYFSAAVILILVGGLSLSIGESVISPLNWLAMLWSDQADAVQRTIIVDLRLPRVLSACLVGATLASAGAAFQGLFRNALAEPYVIGASSGAALGVAISIVLGWQATILGLGAAAAMAMLGAISVVALVLGIGTVVRSWTTSTLLLAGIAISSMVNSLVSALMILNDMRAIAVLSWVMGSLAAVHWHSLAIATVITVPSLLAILASSRALDAFSLGDTTAQSLGMNLNYFRFGLVLAASLATAAAVSLAGIIGFVGLVAPHIARQLVGCRHAVMMPLSLCIGATMMMLADCLSRTIIAPAELPVGIVTAIIGSPFFLWLLLMGSRRSSRAVE